MACRVCDGTDLVPAIDLGEQPWANNFLRPQDAGKEPYYPLRVLFCPACHTAQLDYTVPKETMFEHHTYLSGTTRTLRKHFLDTAAAMNDRFFRDTPGKCVLDIGSNDGTQLRQYQSLGFDALGVESCAEIAELAVRDGVPAVATFLNRETAQDLSRTFRRVIASDIFVHIDEPRSAADGGVRERLRPDGVFGVQYPRGQGVRPAGRLLRAGMDRQGGDPRAQPRSDFLRLSDGREIRRARRATRNGFGIRTPECKCQFESASRFANVGFQIPCFGFESRPRTMCQRP